MKFIVTCCNHEHLLTTLQSAYLDIFIIGEDKLSSRLPYCYELAELTDTISIINNANKAAYIDLRAMITNDLLPYVTEVLEYLLPLQVAGILFSDPAVYMLAKELNCSIPLISVSDTTTTNWFSVKNWYNKGIEHVVIAKELTRFAIESIDSNLSDTPVALDIQVFGPLAMFHSRRKLLNNYYKQLAKINNDEQQYLFDAERNVYYPIIENVSGTHIFSPKDVCLIDEFAFLAKIKHLQFLRIDAFGHTPEFMDKIYTLFTTAWTEFSNNDKEYSGKKQDYLQQVIKLYPNEYRTCDKGFFYKPTIY